MPGGSGFAVAIDDLLKHQVVYVRYFAVGLFAATTQSKLTLAEYKKQIATKKTMRDQVRQMPDQTFSLRYDGNTSRGAGSISGDAVAIVRQF